MHARTQTMPRLYRVILPVADIERAAEVYARLFGVPGERVSGGRHYFDCGGTILGLYDPVADGDEVGEGWKHHAYQYVYFAVADLEGTLDRARALGFRIKGQGIRKMPWGERMFWALDVFENPVSFVDETTLFLGRGNSPTKPA